ncbi:MAG: helix-turn-helix domain-containing protein [Microbacterium sp.]
MTTVERTAAEPGSQTLSRGLSALALIGDAQSPLMINDLAAGLGVNRSAAYRIVRTLEQHRFVQRQPGGELELGVRLAAFGQGVSRDLQSAARPHLQAVADELEMTAFLVASDGHDVVTLLSVEPQHAATFVAQRPGRRQPVGHGAPGRVIRSVLHPEEYPPARFETTHDEVIAGLSAIAVPLHVDQPASIAVLFATRPIDAAAVARSLENAATLISAG